MIRRNKTISEQGQFDTREFLAAHIFYKWNSDVMFDSVPPKIPRLSGIAKEKGEKDGGKGKSK